MKNRLILTATLWAFTAVGSPLYAQDQGQTDGTLHVIRPLIHAEQEEAELCLQFDRDLDTAEERHPTSLVRLESGGKTLPVAAHNVTLAGNLLCLSALDHRREYRLVVSGLRGVKGEKLTTAYSFSFTVPDRPPSLAFSGEAYAGGWVRWSDVDPVLRAVNVPSVKLELIRIEDVDSVNEAWRQRRQTTLAPSESATFARDHGKVVWSGELKPEAALNKTVEQKTSLRAAAANLSSGLYLFVARAPEKKTSDKDLDAFAATGAIWLLRSGIRLHAEGDVKGFYALAEKAGGSGVVKDLNLSIEDVNGQKMAEAKTDANGVAFFALGDDRHKTAVLTGRSDSGDIDFVDLGDNKTGHFVTSQDEVSLALDKPFYKPGSDVSAVFKARDGQGRPVAEAGTVFQIDRPEGGAYTTYPVTLNAAGNQTLSFPAPVVSGVWPVIWQAPDGKILAKATLRTTEDANAPRLEIGSDHTIAPSNGEINLTVKSLTADNKPAPYLTGSITGAWLVPDQIFQEWNDYRFGNGGHPAGEPRILASFITNEKGMALLHLNAEAPDDGSTLHSVVLTAHGDSGQSVADTQPLTLPITPKDNIVGIKPLLPGARFPENSLARFKIVALDNGGHRQSVGELSYQIYEQGRSFDWYQAEGKWNYKPQEQSRRIGGGVLEPDTDGQAIIEWPVASGSYRVEITDLSGAVRASMDFSAGWGSAQLSSAPALLYLSSSTSRIQSGQDVPIRFTLDKPAVVSVYIGDDHIRKVIHQPMPKGDNTVSFKPEKDWGNRIAIYAEVPDLNLAGHLGWSFSHQGQGKENAVSKEVEAPDVFSLDVKMPPNLHTGDTLRSAFELKNNQKSTGPYRASIAVTQNVKIAGLSGASIALSPGQVKTIPFVLTALHAGAAKIKIDINGPAHFHQSREWMFPVLSEEAHFDMSPSQKIEARQIWTPAAEKNRAKNTGGFFFLSPQPLYTAPALLTEMLRLPVLTSTNIAHVLETRRLWRNIILFSGLQSEKEFEDQNEALQLRLLARQKGDGGFPSLPDDTGDLVSTAAVLTALVHAEHPVPQPVIDLAAAWLQHQLENTWFDEKERPLRAAAYAALAEAGRVDSASLHYFGDTSADKSLPPLAAAQLALAFSKSGDADKASFWLDVSGTRKNPEDISIRLLPVLAGNPAFDIKLLSQAFDKLAPSMDKNTGHSLENLTGFLQGMWLVQHRSGNWRVTVNSDKRNIQDVLVVSLPEKTSSPTIHNDSDSPIFLSYARLSSFTTAGPVTRHVYRMSGSELEANAPLARDQTYLIVLEGPWEEAAPRLIHDDPSPGLKPSGCLPALPFAAGEDITWLKDQPLTSLSTCEIWAGGVDMLATKGNADSWRVGYLARANWNGSFDAASPIARSIGDSQDITRGKKGHTEVQ